MQFCSVNGDTTVHIAALASVRQPRIYVVTLHFVLFGYDRAGTYRASTGHSNKRNASDHVYGDTAFSTLHARWDVLSVCPMILEKS